MAEPCAASGARPIAWQPERAYCAPKGRSGHTVAVEADHMYVFGGLIDSPNHPEGTVTNDLHSFHFPSGVWIRLPTRTPPPAMFGHAMVNLHSTLVVFGGRTQNGVCTNGLWLLPLPSAARPRKTLNWQPKRTFAPPSSRWGHSMSIWWRCEAGAGLPEVDGKVVIFGGSDSGLTAYNDTFILDVPSGRFDLLSCRGTAPSPRRRHSAVVQQDRLFIHAGRGETGFLADSHCLDLRTSTWREIVLTSPVPSPIPNSNHSATASTATPPQAPVQRAAHTAVMVDGRMVVFGGSSLFANSEGVCSLMYSDTAAVDLAKEQWVSLTPNSTPCAEFSLLPHTQPSAHRRTRPVASLVAPVTTVPPARSMHTAVVWGDAIYMYGGRTTGHALADLWRMPLQRSRSLLSFAAEFLIGSRTPFWGIGLPPSLEQFLVSLSLRLLEKGQISEVPWATPSRLSA